MSFLVNPYVYAGETTEIEINATNFTQTGSATGWTLGSNSCTATWFRDTAVNCIWMDLASYLGEALGTQWNLRWHQELTSGYVQTTGVGCYLMTGMYNQDGTFSSHSATGLSGSSWNCEAYPAGNDREVNMPFGNNATAYEFSPYARIPEPTAPLWSSNGVSIFFEAIHNGNVNSLQMFTDENYTTPYLNGLSTMTSTFTTDALTHLILCKNYNYSASTWNGAGNFFYDKLYFNNNSLTAGSPF